MKITKISMNNDLKAEKFIFTARPRIKMDAVKIMVAPLTAGIAIGNDSFEKQGSEIDSISEEISSAMDAYQNSVPIKQAKVGLKELNYGAAEFDQ